MSSLILGMKKYDINTYEAAPHETCKRVIRKIDASESQTELERSILTERNPSTLGLRRINNIETVVIVFDACKVPNFIYFGTALVSCSLYHRQHDCCYACGKLGHREDFCLIPDEALCKSCGINNPDENHECFQTCAFCGCLHATTDKSCQEMF
ncbi:hypothetical protein HPB51_019106 [Rhipicephalus microplus]|uniref:CCHC-type domain-containing protein n=1 Tax=Rhipicephalus microplus TaxID=6941 RepID=A0A9J6D6G1_RHIMP|nr:hypothetical protein HPB51_019106 [Rhipicephalus microplus]